MCWGKGYMGKLCTNSQFGYKLKIALKIKIIFKKNFKNYHMIIFIAISQAILISKIFLYQ